MKREVQSAALSGEIEIDLAGDDPTIVVPEGVAIERRPESDAAEQLPR